MDMAEVQFTDGTPPPRECQPIFCLPPETGTQEKSRPDGGSYTQYSRGFPSRQTLKRAQPHFPARPEGCFRMRLGFYSVPCNNSRAVLATSEGATPVKHG
jgi:hypothetical protein